MFYNEYHDPFPEDDLAEVLAQYENLKEVTWAQEEPLNQGAWHSSQQFIRDTVKRHKNTIKVSHVAREASASPAVGHMWLHLQQQAKVVKDAIN